MPEHAHRPECTKWSEKRRDKKNTLGNAPPVGARRPFVVCVQEEHGDVGKYIECDDGQTVKKRDQSTISFILSGFRV